MKKLMKYLKPYTLFAILAPLCMILEVAMDLFQPMFMQNIIDVGIPNGDMDYVIKVFIFMIIAAIIGLLGGVGGSLFAPVAAFGAGADIRNDLFEKVQSLSFKNIDELETGNLITRLTNDIVQIQQMFLMGMRILIRAPFQVIGSFIMVFIISPKLTLILVVIVPMLVASILIILKKSYPLFMRLQERLDKVNKVMQENLSGIRVVKAFVRKDFEEKRFERANEDLTDISLKASKTVATITPIMMFLLNMGIIAVVWFGGFEVSYGNIQVGEVMAFINYLMQLLTALMVVARIAMMVTKAEASANRINEVLETNPAIVDGEKAYILEKVKGKLEFDNVSFSYGNHLTEPVLNNVSFVAEPGQKIAILGSTGSGKTSLVNLIPRFYDIYEGQIRLDGQDIKEMTTQSLRKNIGVCLQQSVLFSGSIRENICYGNNTASFEEVIKVAEIVQADGFIRGFEQGYETRLNQKGVNLSGGQKQRIAIARALLKKPALLILDDSTSAVDVTTEARIQEALDTTMKDTTIFMVAQRISSVLDADKILVLDGGRIVAEGTHDELILSNEVYRDIYESQLGKVGDNNGK
jgi:ATP-binding cassette subfamily B protein